MKNANFACGFCGYSARDNDNLNRHIRTHTGEKPFACPFCPHRASQKTHLKNHIALKHQKDMTTYQHSLWGTDTFMDINPLHAPPVHSEQYERLT